MDRCCSCCSDEDDERVLDPQRSSLKVRLKSWHVDDDDEQKNRNEIDIGNMMLKKIERVQRKKEIAVAAAVVDDEDVAVVAVVDGQKRHGYQSN